MQGHLDRCNLVRCRHLDICTHFLVPFCAIIEVLLYPSLPHHANKNRIGISNSTKDSADPNRVGDLIPKIIMCVQDVSLLPQRHGTNKLPRRQSYSIFYCNYKPTIRLPHFVYNTVHLRVLLQDRIAMLCNALHCPRPERVPPYPASASSRDYTGYLL